MKKFYAICIVGLILLIGSCTQMERQPNILLFITDDESWIERSAYDWSSLPTPHFDRIADQGILFTNAFSSAPSCAPSRAAILTGRNFWELEQGAFIQSFLPNKFIDFTDLLAKNGYHVGNTEKTWAPGVTLNNSHSSLAGVPYNDAKIKNPIDGILPNDYARNFELFLKDKNPHQPFFFWAGIYEPHWPNGKENYKLLEKEYGITPDQIPLFEGIEDTEENRNERANYSYEIAYTDLHLGRMLEQLERLGELDNTLIVVTSDNGTPISRAGETVAKATAYDLGVHVPLAVMWPRSVTGGRKVSDFINLADLAPTFLEIAGISSPEDMSGKSLLPILKSNKSGQIEKSRDFIITGLEWHGELDPVSRSSRTIRDDRFAYITRYNNVDQDGMPLSNEEAIKPAKIEFYDLKNDPWQLSDLAGNKDYADEMKRLKNILLEHGMRTKDPRLTGEMDIFRKTRHYVQERKRLGYEVTENLAF